jgi:hypothetical protein
MRRAGGWHFTSYEKIAETPDQWQLDEAGFRQLEKVTWVVTEKIHGANFCIEKYATFLKFAVRNF